MNDETFEPGIFHYACIRLNSFIFSKKCAGLERIPNSSVKQVWVFFMRSIRPESIAYRLQRGFGQCSKLAHNAKFTAERLTKPQSATFSSEKNLHWRSSRRASRRERSVRVFRDYRKDGDTIRSRWSCMAPNEWGVDHQRRYDCMPKLHVIWLRFRF